MPPSLEQLCAPCIIPYGVTEVTLGVSPLSIGARRVPLRPPRPSRLLKRFQQPAPSFLTHVADSLARLRCAPPSVALPRRARSFGTKPVFMKGVESEKKVMPILRVSQHPARLFESGGRDVALDPVLHPNFHVIERDADHVNAMPFVDLGKLLAPMARLRKNWRVGR